MNEPVQIVDAIDWYDGLVLGGVRIPSLVDLHLAGLYAWAPQHGLRGYIAVPTTLEALTELRRYEWRALQEVVANAFGAHQNAHILLVHDDAGHRLFAPPQERAMSELFPESLIVFDAERALRKDRVEWLLRQRKDP